LTNDDAAYDEAWDRQRSGLMDADAKASKPDRAPRGPKVRYVAIDPAGVEHDRAAERTVWTHLVVILPSLEQDCTRAPNSAVSSLYKVEHGYYERWQNIGWTLNQESAQRLADQQRATGHYAGIEILPVVAR
jgi:hypothetical protein